MSLKPAHAPAAIRRNLAREVVLSLRREIISGKLKQGEPLAEPVLAERFGVSRAPVREALIELEREGLITFEATGRTRVRTLTRRDFEEIMEARSALESMAAQLAAARWSVEDSAAMEKNIAAQSKASTIAELSRLDVEFHAYVMRRSGNERLLRLWQSIRWQFEMSLACTHRLQQKQAFKPPQITIDTHRRMLAALASGKPEVAGRTMAAHMKESIGWLHGKELAWETTPLVKAAAPISRGRGLVTKAVKLVLVTLLGSLTMDASAEADYMKDIKPLLKERCYECHGAMKQKAKLRLDTVALMLKGGENGAEGVIHAFEHGGHDGVRLGACGGFLSGEVLHILFLGSPGTMHAVLPELRKKGRSLFCSMKRAASAANRSTMYSPSSPPVMVPAAGKRAEFYRVGQ